MDFKLIDEAMLRCYVSTYIITSAKEGMFSLCLFHIRNTDRIFIKSFYQRCVFGQGSYH